MVNELVRDSKDIIHKQKILRKEMKVLKQETEMNNEP